MKTSLLYGFLLALAAFLLRLVLFLCGLESDAAHLTAGRWIGSLAGVALGVTLLVLGLRARRRDAPPEEEFTYGQAFLAGMGIQLFSSLFTGIATYFYLTVINPRFTEMILEASRDRMEAKGMSSDQIDQAMRFAGLFFGPTAQAIEGLVGTLIVGAIITAVVAAFLRRPPAHDPLPA